jgi:NAD(P)-dependent dehydrogenase (short-subunit alcohol dehydrogenase family)
VFFFFLLQVCIAKHSKKKIMSASFIIAVDSLEFFNLPHSWLSNENITSIDTARIKMTLVAGLRRRETFKSNAISVASLQLRGFGTRKESESTQTQPPSSSSSTHYQPSKIIRLIRENSISHMFEQINFTKHTNTTTGAVSYETSKVIEFELRLYDKEGERKLSLISQSPFPLQEAIKAGSFPEGIFSPKIYFKLDPAQYDGATVAVMGGHWRRVHIGDPVAWVNNEDVEAFGGEMDDNVASQMQSANNNNVMIANSRGGSKSEFRGQNEPTTINHQQQQLDQQEGEEDDDFGSANAIMTEESGAFDAMIPNREKTVTWGAPTSRVFRHDNTNMASLSRFNMYQQQFGSARSSRAPSVFLNTRQNSTNSFHPGGQASTLFQQTNSSTITNNTNNNSAPRRLVVITGGARTGNIGANLVRLFLQNGYLVSTCDILKFDKDEIKSWKRDAFKKLGIPFDEQELLSTDEESDNDDDDDDDDQSKNKTTNHIATDSSKSKADMTLEEKQRKVLKMQQQQEENVGTISRSKSEKFEESHRQDSNKPSSAAAESAKTSDSQHHTKTRKNKNRKNPRILHTFSNCDITKEEDVKKFIERTAAYFPEETHWLCLINNAAIANPYMSQPQQTENVPTMTPLANLSIPSFMNYINVNVLGAVLMMKYCAKYLQPRKVSINQNTFREDDPDGDFFGGSIINISSTRAAMSEPNSEGYAASKGALESLTHAVAISNPRIRVNAIRLGWVNVMSDYVPSFQDHSWHAAGRVGRASDVFGMCKFLADNELSGFVTGATMVLDGGVTRKMVYPE